MPIVPELHAQFYHAVGRRKFLEFVHGTHSFHHFLDDPAKEKKEKRIGQILQKKERSSAWLVAC